MLVHFYQWASRLQNQLGMDDVGAVMKVEYDAREQSQTLEVHLFEVPLDCHQDDVLPLHLAVVEQSLFQ